MSTAVSERLAAGARRRSRRHGLGGRLLRHAVLVIATVLSLYPLAFMVMTALKTNRQYLNDTYGLPWPLDFGHFADAFQGGEFAALGCLVPVVSSCCRRRS